MICRDISKLLKRFQDDLLSGEDYQAFIAHLNSCPKCKKYVRSIGSLSNQLWELGDVKVPDDLCSTIMFKLKSPSQEVKAPKFVISKKIMVGSLILFFVLPAVFFTINNIRKQSEVKETVEAPKILEVTAPFNKEEITEEELEKPEELVWEYNIADSAAPSEAPSAETVSKVESLHWHIQLSEGIDNTKDRENKRKVDLYLQQSLAQMKELENKIKRLKKISQGGFKTHYSEDVRSATSKVEQQSDLELQKKIAAKKQLNDNIRKIKGRKNQIELNSRQSNLENKRKKTALRTKLLNALNVLGIRQDYYGHNMLIFTALGEKIDPLLEQILSVSEKPSSFHDFTTEIYTLPDKEYHIFICLEQEAGDTLHWHLSPVIAAQKSNVFDVVSKFSSLINYESEEWVVFSVSRSKIDELRRKIQSMRIPFSEYGYVKSEKNALISNFLTISIYFSNEDSL